MLTYHGDAVSGGSAPGADISCAAALSFRLARMAQTVYPTTPAKRIAASHRSSSPSRTNTQSSTEIPTINGTSRRTRRHEITSGITRAHRPTISRMLKMLLPTTLPIAMSDAPLRTADTLTAISGELVPNATTVRPTTSGEMPADSAILDAPRTSPSAPATSRIRPATSIKIVVASIGSAP